MADVRCPMCGKPNSAELEVCQFCQARLKPLVVKPDAEPEPPKSSTSISEAKTQPVPPPSPEPETPDWLQSLRPEISDPDKDGTQSFPEWLFDESEPKSSAVFTDAGGSNEQDWLSSFRQGGEMDADVPAADDEAVWSAQDEPDDKSVPDWLKDLRPSASTEAPYEAGEALSDVDETGWLQRIRDRQKMEAGQEEPVEETEEDLLQDQGLDTLQSTGERVDSFDRPPASVVPPSMDNEIPDWLSGLGESAADDDAKDLPDWLMSGSGSDATNDEPEMPAWLSEASKEIPPKPPQQPPLPPVTVDSSFESQIPPWLAGFVTGDVEQAKGESQEQEEEKFPSWLGDLEKNASLEQPQSSASSEGRADFGKMGASDRNTVETPPELEQSVAPFTFDDEESFISDELPDWLKGVSAQDAQQETPAPTDAEGSLAPSDLPVWLEAMRPVEAVALGASAPISDERDQVVEGSGPLAGLQGILRAEPDIARQKKPAAYTIKLQVSESHQAHVALLENLIKSEGAVRPVSSGVQLTSQQVLRWIIFVVLLLAVAWPVFTGSVSVPLPLMAPEAVDARGFLDALPDGSTALVAVEYEPGYSGELDAAVSSVIDHLMIKGAYLALVSTSPLGPAQAERLVTRVSQGAGHGYLPVGQYTNLGFIPGGTAGLLGFAGAPQRILPYSLEIIPGGGSVWETGPLSSVQKISDFGIVLVITENPETARAWIEQVQPALGSKPMIMVLSAQAEPMVRPYYAGIPRQVQGMIVGLAGGAGYESSMPRTGLARQYWDGYSYGLAAAILLMILAGLGNILATVLAARRQPEGEA